MIPVVTFTVQLFRQESTKYPCFFILLVNLTFYKKTTVGYDSNASHYKGLTLWIKTTLRIKKKRLNRNDTLGKITMVLTIRPHKMKDEMLWKCTHYVEKKRYKRSACWWHFSTKYYTKYESFEVHVVCIKAKMHVLQFHMSDFSCGTQCTYTQNQCIHSRWHG